MQGSSIKVGIETAEPPAFQGPGRSGQLSRRWWPAWTDKQKVQLNPERERGPQNIWDWISPQDPTDGFIKKLTDLDIKRNVAFLTHEL